MGEKIVILVDRGLEDLMPLFIKTRQADLRGLSEGLAAGDFQALRNIGHSMKGSGSSFGFDLVTDLGEQIEVAALAQNANSIRVHTSTFEDYLSRIEIQFV